MSYSVARFVFDSDGKRMWGFVFNSVCILEPEMYERCGPRRPRPYGEKCSCEGEPCSVFCGGDPMGWRGKACREHRWWKGNREYDDVMARDFGDTFTNEYVPMPPDIFDMEDA